MSAVLDWHGLQLLFWGKCSPVIHKSVAGAYAHTCIVHFISKQDMSYSELPAMNLQSHGSGGLNGWRAVGYIHELSVSKRHLGDYWYKSFERWSELSIIVSLMGNAFSKARWLPDFYKLRALSITHTNITRISLLASHCQILNGSKGSTQFGIVSLVFHTNHSRIRIWVLWTDTCMTAIISEIKIVQQQAWRSLQH